MSDTPDTDAFLDYWDYAPEVGALIQKLKEFERERKEMTELASEMADRLSSIGKGGGGRHPLAYRFDKIKERTAKK